MKARSSMKRLRKGERGMQFLSLMIALTILSVFMVIPTPGYGQTACNNTVVADVVALDQNYFLNRLGSLNNLGMVYALKRDVYTNAFDAAGEFIGQPCDKVACAAGQVVMRPDKRPRPIALRVAKGDCLQINFTNLLNPLPIDPNEQNVTRDASAHVTGLPLVNGIAGDGSWVGANASSLVAPGNSATYTYYAQDENVFMITNMANTTGSQGAGGSLTFGLTGVVIVEPVGAEFYRGHVSNEDLSLAACNAATLAGPNPATDCLVKANQNRTPADQPIINYDAVYPNVEPFITENKAGIPILRMTQGANTVHSDIHAIITGPNKGNFAAGATYPSTATNPLQNLPFREAASIFGDEQFNVQSFPLFFNDPVLKHTFNITKDGFVINYGSGGIGPEIIANRLLVGPMWDCPECKAEEFFLTSWAIGDVGMWVDIPANGCIQNQNPNVQNQNLPLVAGISVDPQVTPINFQGNLPGPFGDRNLNISCENGGGIPTPGVKATVALYPDDPSTIHHAYIHDHFKFRNIHAGPFEHHIFHLHNNQWVFSPKSDKANYQDMQQIGPGSSYTMDLVNGGAGNRNANPGDAIYHCHFYPHFAQGMWADLRMHDVFEEGTVLNPRVDPLDPTRRAAWALRDAPPALGSRAYPDGEVKPAAVAGAGTCIEDPNFDGLCTGSPIPAVVPMPLYPMAPAPAVASVDPADPRRIVVTANTVTGQTNPGFPFYIPGVAGHRPPSPPLDIAVLADGTPIDGGLPRHVILGDGETEYVVNRYDINKELHAVDAELVPEGGTPVEQASFAFHAQRCHDTYLPNGTAATCQGANSLGQKFWGGFITNGLPPKPGAPHSDPCVDNAGNPFESGKPAIFNSANCETERTGCTGFTLTGNLFDSVNPRPYKIANIQIDLVLNKKGWHQPQQRIISLWGDVAQQYAGTLAPAPMTFRLNTMDCSEVWHANLVPNFYELDDFQVRTPTDIIAQHSHMTKFDVASSDGAANLWNYEDGTFSPGEVVERIEAINRRGGLIDPATGARTHLVAKTHPYFEGLALPYQTVTIAECTGKTCGTRTTVQRWAADPVFDNAGVDRGIGNVFTHDHFGPSTFQQLGLYATIMAEPQGSQWLHNETAAPLATRTAGGVKSLTADGGPTSWQAQIIPPAGVQAFNNVPYREFYFENSDFQQAYKRAFNGTLNLTSFLDAIARPSRDGDPLAIYVFNDLCPGSNANVGGVPLPQIPSPCPMAIGGGDQGTEVVNYRNEPVGARIFDPVTTTQAAGFAGDLSFAYASILRADPDLNLPIQSFVRNTIQCPSCLAKPGLGTCGLVGSGQNGAVLVGNPLADFRCVNGIAGLPIPTTAGVGPEIINPAAAALSADVRPLDPATPMMRVYEGDKVKIRMQVGATEESHHFSIHGAKWLMNYADPNSGWRNVQSMGISEQFQFDFPVLGDLLSPGAQNVVDYLYASNMSNSGLFNGEWGLFRTYGVLQPNLARLPNSLVVNNRPIQIANRRDLAGQGLCPANAPVKGFDVTVLMARDVLPAVPGIVNPLGVSVLDGLPGGTLIYNSRPDLVPDNNVLGVGLIPGGQGPLHDPAAILYVKTADIAGLRAGLIKPEPLILRANAGDCINVLLRNRLPLAVPDLNGVALTYEPVIDKCVNDICPPTGALGTNFKPTFNSNDIFPSAHAGLHAQLVSYNGAIDDGTNVGQNILDNLGNLVAGRFQTAGPGENHRYTWYAGDFIAQPAPPQGPNQRVNLIARNIEYGVIGLAPSDKLEQASRGLMGALVIEPAGAVCTPDLTTNFQATCTGPAGTYREFVALTQNNVKMYFANPGAGVFAGEPFQPIPGFPTEEPLIGVADDAEDSGVKGVNYKSEPYWFRLKMAPGTPLAGPNGQQTFATAALYSNSQVGGLDPETPIYTAANGSPFRFYFVEPSGNQRSDVPVIHGHPWQRSPYASQTQPLAGSVESAVIALNPQSQVVGAQEGYGPAGHWNFLPEVLAGGPFGATGDYLYRMQNPPAGYHGSWGLFRVQ